MPSKRSPLDIDCIMPAAVLSSRMGDWKLLLPYSPDGNSADANNDSTILETSVNNALAVCSRVILVAGYRSDELIEKMSGYSNVKIVVNPDYQLGMFSSIQRSIEQVRSEHFFISHGDMPCISAEVYQQLWQARTVGTVFPGDEKQSGHPVLINASLKQAVMDAPENGSMKAILRAFPMAYLKLKDDNIHFDIDTPAAYKKLRNT